LKNPKHGSTLKGTPVNFGRNRGGKWKSGSRRKKTLISVKRGKTGPRLLLRTNTKSSTRFQSVPNSTTLDDLEGSMVIMHSVSKRVRGAPWLFISVSHSICF